MLLPEVGLLGLALFVVGVLRPATAMELPLGPLGGLASTTGAIVACVAGIALAAAVTAGPVARRTMPGWALAVAGTAVVVSIGAGFVAVRGDVVVPVLGVPDVVGLALRAAAVGVFARHGVGPVIGAALVLGVGETLLRSQFSTGEAALLPALGILAWSVWSDARSTPETAAA